MKKIFLLLFFLSFSISVWAEDVENKTRQVVQVVEPFIDIHTGPGRAFPKFYVAERGDWIELLKRKTTWFKVRLSNGKQGWVPEEQLTKTLSPSGQTLDLALKNKEDFLNRRWEIGLGGGEFGGADLISVGISYNFTSNISTELTLSQAIGTFSKNTLYDLGLVHQIFSEGRVSPFLGLGVARINTTPKATLVTAEDRSDDAFYSMVGVKAYLTRRFMLRIEYKNYLLLTSRDDDEEIELWKFGFSAFF